MLTIHASGGAITVCSSCFDNSSFHLASPSRRTAVNSSSRCSSKAHCLHENHKSYFSSKHVNVTHHYVGLHHQQASKVWLCRNSFDDDDYRSSRNIAITLFRRYKNFIDRGGGDNLKEFIRAGVNAYALGCTDEGLRKELDDMKDSGFDIESMDTYGGNTSLKSRIASEEITECILWLSIIFITILCTPQPTIVRWSAISPVSDGIKLQWKGFCALIANAYFVRGMAWLPVKTLQLEQMAVVGTTEEPSVVASRMLLVFTTLEVVSPQWPIY